MAETFDKQLDGITQEQLDASLAEIKTIIAKKEAADLEAAKLRAGWTNNSVADANKIRKATAPRTDDLAPSFSPVFSPSAWKDGRVRISLPDGANRMFYNDPRANLLLTPLQETSGVVFPFVPQIVINNAANYSALSPSQTNYPYQVYQNSQIGTINLFGQFTAQTPADARYVLAVITFMRLATKSFRNDDEHAGNPPIILKLTGHGKNLLPSIPVVIQSFDLTLPKEVDYITTPVPYDIMNIDNIPTITDISITMTPVYSRQQLSKFNMADIANGNNLGGFI